ncbi:hypothetical protein BZL42_09615 [Pseudomonas indica]|nr:hypothetical protein BZL42_09615 [Pseudomonas indica]
MTILFQWGIRKVFGIADTIAIKSVIALAAKEEIISSHSRNDIVVLISLHGVVARARIDMIVSISSGYEVSFIIRDR